MIGPYLLATRSAGKLLELRPLFQQYGVLVLDLDEGGISFHPDEEHIEVFGTFAGNACAKSEYFFQRSGLPTFADDSGLCVYALGGEPGIYSKRWSGRADLIGEALDQANNAMLCARLGGVAIEVSRGAEYVCAASFTDRTGTVVRLGSTPGEIIRSPLGNGGFGYDPYFLSSELGQTFGEASLEQKNAVSHRGRAFAALLAEVNLISPLSSAP